MTQDPMQDAHERIDALFADQPTGQRIRATARGVSRIGNKPFTIIVESELPINAEAQEDGARQQLEVGFHAMFGPKARHVDAEGNENPDLREAIEVEVEGEPDYAAAAETREQMSAITREAVEKMQQAGLAGLMERAIRPDDDGASLN